MKGLKSSYVVYRCSRFLPFQKLTFIGDWIESTIVIKNTGRLRNPYSWWCLVVHFPKMRSDYVVAKDWIVGPAKSMLFFIGHLVRIQIANRKKVFVFCSYLLCKLSSVVPCFFSTRIISLFFCREYINRCIYFVCTQAFKCCRYRHFILSCFALFKEELYLS